MKKLIARIQSDISKLQDSVQKEGNDLLDKIKKIDLKSNIEQTKTELKKVLTAKLKKIEPTYHTFVEELRKNVKKAGIDIDKIEKGIKKKASAMKKKGSAKGKLAKGKTRRKTKKTLTQTGQKSDT